MVGDFILFCVLATMEYICRYILLRKERVRERENCYCLVKMHTCCAFLLFYILFYFIIPFVFLFVLCVFASSVVLIL